MTHQPREVRIFSRHSARAMDRAAEAELGIPGILLMEHAAEAIEEAALDLMARHGLGQALIFAGPGANGGDGFALARRLSNRAAPVTILLAFDAAGARGDAATNLTICRRMGVEIADILHFRAAPESPGADPRRTLVVDTLLGTGADRAPEGLIARAIDHISRWREQGATVLAVDLPSGLDCDSGVPLGERCVRADLTVTLAGMKLGLATDAAKAWAGRVLVGDIGVPCALLRRFGDPFDPPAGRVAAG